MVRCWGPFWSLFSTRTSHFSFFTLFTYNFVSNYLHVMCISWEVLNLERLLLNMFSLICESLSYTLESVQCLPFSLEQWLFIFDLYGHFPQNMWSFHECHEGPLAEKFYSRRQGLSFCGIFNSSTDLCSLVPLKLIYFSESGLSLFKGSFFPSLDCVCICVQWQKNFCKADRLKKIYFFHFLHSIWKRMLGK